MSRLQGNDRFEGDGSPVLLGPDFEGDEIRHRLVSAAPVRTCASGDQQGPTTSQKFGQALLYGSR